MQYQQTPQGLEQLYNLPPEAQVAGMNLLTQQQNADRTTLADQNRQYAYDTANDPLKLTGKDLDNQTLQAHLPGIQAESRMHVRKDSNEALLNDDVLKDWRGKYSSAEQARHVEEAANAGSRIAQVAEDIRYNPIGSAARAKKAVEEVGGHWDPSWDNMPPEQLAQHLNNYGTAVQTTSAKLQTQLDLQRLKNQPMYYGADARVLAAQARAANGGQPKPEKMTEWEARMRVLAANGDKQAAAALQAFEQAKIVRASVGAGITQSGAVDLDALQPKPGKPGQLAPRGAVPLPQTPSALQTTPGEPAPQAAPSAAPAKAGYSMQSPEGMSWIQRAKAANPGMSEQEIVQQGYKSGKLK